MAKTEKTIKPQIPSLAIRIANNKEQQRLLDSISDVNINTKKGSSWGDLPKSAVEKLCYIGHDAGGGCFAAWLLEETDVDVAPIVYIGSEGEAACLASNFKEALQIFVALGSAWHDVLNGPTSLSEMRKRAQYALDEQETLAEDEPELRGDLEVYGQILDAHQIPPANDAVAAINRAQKANPNFEKWLSSLMK